MVKTYFACKNYRKLQENTHDQPQVGNGNPSRPTQRIPLCWKYNVCSLIESITY